ERLVHRLLAAVGHQDLGRVHLVAGVALGLLGDGGAQLGQPARRRVLVEARHPAGGHRGLDDVVGSGEVGLARTEPDDRAARRLERLGLGVDGQRGGFGYRGDALGDARTIDAHLSIVTDGVAWPAPYIRASPAIRFDAGASGTWTHRPRGLSRVTSLRAQVPQKAVG